MLDVTLLGQFAVLLDGRRLAIPTRQAQSLFAYLVLNAGTAHRRERLAGLLWPDSNEENARGNLRHELWRVRKALKLAADDYFLIDDLTIAFNPQSAYTLDVQHLERVSVDSTADDLLAALSVYRGEFLPGFYADWVLVERDRLAALYERTMGRLLELLQQAGRWAEVLEWGRRWIGTGHWPEAAYRALMTAYASSGDMANAVAVYERLTQDLQHELGLDPSEQTQALYHRLKAGWRMDMPTQGPDPPTPRVAGAVPSASLRRGRRSNLPRPLTSFIGRAQEFQQVEHLVSRARLVTITGSGGVGKTRLAIQVAGTLTSSFRDGAWWVELAALIPGAPSTQQELAADERVTRSPDSPTTDTGYAAPQGIALVVQALAKALRVPEVPGLSLWDGVVEHLLDKQLLVVLDNCEHLIGACATLAERLLAHCPEVTILATSREALGVPGEKAWLLPSLSLPAREQWSDAGQILQSEAVSLFVERAADLLPGYQPGAANAPTLAQICVRLDGIPLAIELAAARMHLLSAPEIAARLDQRFSLLTGGHRTALPRHQTLRAAIEWSYDLLDQAEQVVLRRLAVFAGSFSLDAAEAICAGDEVRQDDVLTVVGRLVAKSMLNVEPAAHETMVATRYRLLDTIGSFGRIKLDAAKEPGLVRDRHAAYYVRLVEAAEPELFLQHQARWYRLLQAEHDNLRAVVEWSVESDQAERALRLVGASLWYWFSTGSIREGHDLAVKALAAPSAARLREVRARALNMAGFLACWLGETAAAKRWLDEAIAILRQSDDAASLAWSLQFLGMAYSFERAYDRADAALAEGVGIARQLVDAGIYNWSFFQGDIDLHKGDRARAKKTYEASATFQRVVGNRAFLAYPLRRLGYLALEQNDLPSAGQYFLESLTFNREAGDMPGATASLTSMASLALRLSKPVVAAYLYGAVERRLEALSINLLYLDQVELGQVATHLHAALDEATLNAALTEGWGMGDDQAFVLVGELVGATSAS